jgi:hypothetical protein
MFSNSKYLKQVLDDLLRTRLATALDTSDEAFAEFEEVFNRVTPTEPEHEILREAVRYFYTVNRFDFKGWIFRNRQLGLALWADCSLAARVLGLDGIVYIRWNPETKRYECRAHQRCEETIRQIRLGGRQNAAVTAGQSAAGTAGQNAAGTAGQNAAVTAGQSATGTADTAASQRKRYRPPRVEKMQRRHWVPVRQHAGGNQGEH